VFFFSGMPTPFQEKVYLLTKEIPRGKVTTYKLLAESLNTKAYRAVGQALKHNPYAPVVPCHRVINSDGSLGGFAFGRKRKMELLKKEGILIKKNKINLFHYQFSFK